MKPACRFDAEQHAYYIGSHRVDGVTGPLRDVLPGWQADEWHMQRGRAVHACAALIARGMAFDFDPCLIGQVEACRRFFREIEPRVIEIETPVYSITYRYAGTPDLTCQIPIDERKMVLDWKSAITPALIYQLAAYALAHDPELRWGVGVELHDDGTYKMSEIYDLKGAKREWLALLTTYRVRQRCGISGMQRRSEE